MVDEFYTHFQFEFWSRSEDRTIGLARFDQMRVYYPSSAVVKVYRDKAAGHTEFNLLQMCRSLHRNVLKLYAYYDTSHYTVLFLEHCEGGVLSESLASGQRRTQAEVVDMMEDIAQTIAALHSNFIAHRDVKPHNIFLTNNHICKLGDFETARYFPNCAAIKTIPKGTIAYMPPEKLNALNSGEDLKPERAFLDDIWAMGKTFFEICIGKIDSEVNFALQGADSLRIHIYREMQAAGRSDSLSSLLFSMLSSHDLTADSVLSAITQLKTGSIEVFVHPSSALKCCICAEELTVLTLNCGHCYCKAHFRQHLVTVLSSPNVTLMSQITCLMCAKQISCEFFRERKEEIPPELQGKLKRMERMSAVEACGCEGGALYQVVMVKNGKAVPYVRVCSQCRLKACSWCRAKGGHGLRWKAKCPEFPYY